MQLSWQYLFVVSGGIFYQFACYQILYDAYKPPFVYCAFCIYFLIAIASYYPPIMAASYVVTLQCLKSVVEANEVYLGELAHHGGHSDIQVDLAEKLIRKGERVAELGSKINYIFGGILALDFGVSLFILNFTVFFTLLIVQVIALNEFLWQTFFFSVTCGSFTVFFIIHLYSLVRAGQSLKSTRRRIWRQLQSLNITARANMSRETSARADATLRKFETFAVVRPLGAFRLGYDSWVRTILVLSTHIIILMQFKQENTK